MDNYSDTPKTSFLLIITRFAMWINEVSSLFGGLDMCSIKVVQDTNGDYFIQDVFGSEFALLGDGQEEDRMRIAELVLQKMEELIRAPAALTPFTIPFSLQEGHRAIDLCDNRASRYQSEFHQLAYADDANSHLSRVYL
ncbi:unnamed protein product, partial [Dibothriocephalus latus]